MGLDGISTGQLRFSQELTHVDSSQSKTYEMPSKVISGLSEGQKVDPDKERQNNQQEAFFGQKKSDDEENEEEKAKFDLSKIDLSQTSKYELIMDEKTNSIAIVEKSTREVVQTIDADRLSVFVQHLVNATGAIVNRKF